MAKREIVYVIGPSIAYVPLTRGLFAVIDLEDVPVICSRPWYAIPANHCTYAACSVGGKTVSMHRFLMGTEHNGQYDHRNLHGLDNRRDNLRPATVMLNQMNTRRRVDNSSGFKGVYKSGSRWRSRIQFGKKYFDLGHFATPEQAHEAYMKKAREYAGEFANAG